MATSSSVPAKLSFSSPSPVPNRQMWGHRKLPRARGIGQHTAKLMLLSRLGIEIKGVIGNSRLDVFHRGRVPGGGGRNKNHADLPGDTGGISLLVIFLRPVGVSLLRMRFEAPSGIAHQQFLAEAGL